MAITLVGTPQAGSAINAGDVTLTFDVAPQENDVVVVWGGPSIVGSSAIVTSGYTAISADQLNSQCRAWYKRMGATPDTTVVGDGGADARDAVGYLSWVLRGVDTTTALDTAATLANGTGSSPNPPTITTVTDGAWVFAFASLLANDATPGDLSNYSNQVIANATDTFNLSVTGMTREIGTASAEDPPTYTGWSGTWGAVTAAIRPAAGGGDGQPPNRISTPIGLGIFRV